MALNEITQAVLDRARKNAELIVKSAQAASEEKVEAWRKNAETEMDKKFQSIKLSIEEEFSRKLIQMQGISNKAVLTKKNELLQQVFAQAKAKILSMPREEYRKVFKRLLEKSVGQSGGALRIHPEDKAVFEEMLAEFNEIRDEKDHVRLLDEQPLPERGGFIFVSDRFQVDQSLSTLLSDVQYESAPEISAALFSDDSGK